MNLQPNFQKRGEGLTRHQILNGGCRERGGEFFRGGGRVQFSQNKFKSEIFNDRESL